jgi:hypothetical protein
MDVLRHQDIEGNYKSIVLPGSLHFILEDGVSACSREEWLSLVAAECNEMELPGLLETNQVPGHGSSSRFL